MRILERIGRELEKTGVAFLRKYLPVPNIK